MKKLVYKAENGKTIVFDEFVDEREEYGSFWATICPKCREKYGMLLGARIADHGSGCCSVDGCTTLVGLNAWDDEYIDADMRYVDFDADEVEVIETDDEEQKPFKVIYDYGNELSVEVINTDSFANAYNIAVGIYKGWMEEEDSLTGNIDEWNDMIANCAVWIEQYNEDADMWCTCWEADEEFLESIGWVEREGKMKLTEIKTKRYEYNGFWVDIVDLGEELEAWLTKKNFGISEYMFGMPKVQPNGEDIDLDAFCEIVEANLDEYIEDYAEEYM